MCDKLIKLLININKIKYVINYHKKIKYMTNYHKKELNM